MRGNGEKIAVLTCYDASFATLLEAQGVDVLLVGDSLSDAQAARAAGCPIICVPYGYNHGEPVETLNVDAVIADLTGVLPLIKPI